MCVVCEVYVWDEGSVSGVSLILVLTLDCDGSGSKRGEGGGGERQ